MEAIKCFFSYSRVDSGFVLKLATDLKNEGLNAWLDQLDIQPGSRWDASIEHALNEAEVMLVVLSNSSVKSENVLDEVSYAINKGKRVIPLLIDNCEVPFRIARFQRIDFASDYNTGLRNLVKTLNTKQSFEKKTSEPEPKVAVLPPEEAKSKKANYTRVLLGIAAIIILALAFALFYKKDPPHEEVQDAKGQDTFKAAQPSTNSSTINSSVVSSPLPGTPPSKKKFKDEITDQKTAEEKQERPQTKKDPVGGVDRPANDEKTEAPANKFRVVEVMLRADPFDFSGACPHQIVFSGRVSVAGGNGVVSYKFLRNDGASAPVETITFDGPGTRDIKTNWYLGATYTGWQQIQILDPVEMKSNKADFKLTCQ